MPFSNLLKEVWAAWRLNPSSHFLPSTGIKYVSFRLLIISTRAAICKVLLLPRPFIGPGLVVTGNRPWGKFLGDLPDRLRTIKQLLPRSILFLFHPVIWIGNPSRSENYPALFLTDICPVNGHPWTCAACFLSGKGIPAKPKGHPVSLNQHLSARAGIYVTPLAISFLCIEKPFWSIANRFWNIANVFRRITKSFWRIAISLWRIAISLWRILISLWRIAKRFWRIAKKTYRKPLPGGQKAI